MSGVAPMSVSWTARHVGTPYAPRGSQAAGCDCWGLVLRVYRMELGIVLPAYVGAASLAEAEEARALLAGAASPTWRPANPAPFAVALFRRGYAPTHIGIVVAPGLMLHMAGEDCAKVESYAHGPWAARLLGHWRHVALQEEAAR